jgi:uncharacterized protein YjbJ (UPF0337 family)
LNKNRVNGTIDEVVGSAKRKAGELTGNTKLQVKGMAQQVKGKVENAWGKTTDAIQKAIENTEVHIDTHVNLEVKNPTGNINRNKNK